MTNIFGDSFIINTSYNLECFYHVTLVTLLSYIPVVILNVSIMSPFTRLYFNVGNLKFLNLSSYSIFFICGSILVARLCTFSIELISFFLYGDQTLLAFSKCGRTSALNNKLKVLLSRCKNALLISPKIWFALLI